MKLLGYLTNDNAKPISSEVMHVLVQFDLEPKLRVTAFKVKLC